MRVVVTGGGGFIGSHVVDALVERGHEVVVVDSFDRSVHAEEPPYLNPSARVARADVRDRGRMERELRGADAVSHHAAVVGVETSFDDATRYVTTNDVGTVTVLAAAISAGVGRFVLASSMAVYGEGAYLCAVCGPRTPRPRETRDLADGRFDPPCPSCGAALAPVAVTEERAPDPRSVYAATKLHQEHLAFAAARSTGLAVTALRYHNVYGPRMPRNSPYAGVAAVFRGALEEGRAPRVFEDGAQRRDFVHVRDVARASVLALETPDPIAGAVNVGSGEPHTVLDLARALSCAIGGPQPEVTGDVRAGDVRHVFASSEKAARLLGYRAEVPFDRGVRELARSPLRAPVA